MLLVSYEVSQARWRGGNPPRLEVVSFEGVHEVEGVELRDWGMFHPMQEIRQQIALAHPGWVVEKIQLYKAPVVGRIGNY